MGLMLLGIPRFHRLFLHFFDLHFLDLKGLNQEPRIVKKQIQNECRLATRFAVLAADEVLLPAASFFESEMCYEIISELRELYSSGLLRLVGGGANLEEYFADKLSQYSQKSVQYKRYRTFEKRLQAHPPFVSRRQSASSDISQGWIRFLNVQGIGRIVQGLSLSLARGFEERWAQVPERLEGRAFIVDHVVPLLFDSPGSNTIRNRLHSVINAEYFASFTREFCAGVVDDLVYLAAPHIIPSYDKDLPYRDVFREIRWRGLVKFIEQARTADLVAFRDDPRWNESTAAALVSHNRRLASIPHQTNQMKALKLDAATIGVVTALPQEFAAVCEVFHCEGPIDVSGTGAGRKYAIAHLPARSGAEHVVAVCLLTEMGNDSAAIRATQMTFHCRNIQHIIMTGIAGAVPNPSKPEDHVRLGDIVVSSRIGVVQYDLDKESPTEVEHRHPPRPPAALLLEAVKWLTAGELRGERPWDAYTDASIRSLGRSWERPGEYADQLQEWDDKSLPVQHPPDPQRITGRPRIFQGTIASANKLLKNPAKRDALRDKFHVKAVEMEGAGIADATWNMEKGYLVVRGTCDYCNPDKGDTWHKYSAVVAAAYTAQSLRCYHQQNVAICSGYTIIKYWVGARSDYRKRD